MFDILSAVGIFGIITFSILIYLKWRTEAKNEGFISDEYIENNGEDEGE